MKKKEPKKYSRPCLDCGGMATPFEILERDGNGRRKIRYLCVDIPPDTGCGMVMDVWENRRGGSF